MYTNFGSFDPVAIVGQQFPKTATDQRLYLATDNTQSFFRVNHLKNKKVQKVPPPLGKLTSCYTSIDYSSFFGHCIKESTAKSFCQPVNRTQVSLHQLLSFFA